MAKRLISFAIAAALTAGALPVQAQIFWKPYTGTQAPATGIDLPGATLDEQRAAYAWHLRAALNVAALQCDFEPTLLTVSNYNAAIAHHKDELAKSFSTLGAYFQRTAGGGKAGQSALDKFGTRIYSSYSAVQAQRAFCSMAGIVGREAIFAPRGGLYTVAQRRLGDIQRALAGAGESFYVNPAYGYRAILPPNSGKCWAGDMLTPDCQAQWGQMVRKGARK